MCLQPKGSTREQRNGTFPGCAHFLKNISATCNVRVILTGRPTSESAAATGRTQRCHAAFYTPVLSQSWGLSGSQHKSLLSWRSVMNLHTLFANGALCMDVAGMEAAKNMTFKSCFVEQSILAHIAVPSLCVLCRIRLIEHGLNWINRILHAGTQGPVKSPGIWGGQILSYLVLRDGFQSKAWDSYKPIGVCDWLLS